MHKIGAAFLAGVWVLHQFSTLPPWQWLLGLGLIGLGLLILRLGWLAAFCLAFSWAGSYGHLRLANELPVDAQAIDLQVVGKVAGIPEASGRRVRFLFDIESIAQDPKIAPMRARLSWYGKYPQLVPGSRWTLTARLKRPHGFMNPGGFDYEAWLFEKRVRATGYVRAGEQNSPDSQRVAIDRLRAGISANIEKHDLAFPQLLAALVVGDRQGISKDLWQVFTRTGTNHLMAISGLHIGLAAAAGYFLCAWLWRFSRYLQKYCLRPLFSVWGSLAFALCYSALAGFQIPTQRALIMLLVVLLSTLLRRPLKPLHGLSVALIAVLVFDPSSILSAGFWLSFFAVAVIVFLLAGRPAKQNKMLIWSKLQVGLALALLPLALTFFQRGSLVAPLANLVAIPLVSLLVVPLALVGTLLEPLLSDLLNPCYWLADHVLILLVSWLGWLAELDLSQWRHALPQDSLAKMVALGFSLLAILLLLAPRAFPFRWLALPLSLPLLLPATPRLQAGEFELSLLDVGQGLAAVIETRNHVLVYDTGARFAADFDVGEAVLEPFLRDQGLAKRIDKLVISHGDNDHAGGFESLQALIPITEVLTSVADEIKHPTVKSCMAGQAWVWDKVRFQVLHPTDEKFAGNNRSCVLRVEAGPYSLLLPGDIEAAAEVELVAANSKLQADVLVAPHHGSKSSSTQSFVSTVSPRYLLYPVGHLNRFGFPHPEVSARYAKLGAQQLLSADTGTIRIIVNAQIGISEPRLYRQQALRYWHARGLFLAP